MPRPDPLHAALDVQLRVLGDDLRHRCVRAFARHLRDRRRAALAAHDGPVTLTLEDLAALVRRSGLRCERSTVPFSLDRIGGVRLLAPSLDRIDPEGDYTLANLRLVCWYVKRTPSPARADGGSHRHPRLPGTLARQCPGVGRCRRHTPRPEHPPDRVTPRLHSAGRAPMSTDTDDTPEHPATPPAGRKMFMCFLRDKGAPQPPGNTLPYLYQVGVAPFGPIPPGATMIPRTEGATDDEHGLREAAQQQSVGAPHAPAGVGRGRAA